MTENRLLEADLALLNSMQRQGIGEKKKKSLLCSALHFSSCRINVPASSCRRSPARPSLPGVSGWGRPAGSLLLGKVRHIPSLPLPRMTQSVIKDFQLPAKNGISSRAPEGRRGDVRNGFCSCLRVLTHTHTLAHTLAELMWSSSGKSLFCNKRV